MDLQILAVVVTELRFLNGKLGNLLCAVFTGNRVNHRGDQLVYLLLRVIGDLSLSFALALNECGDFGRRIGHVGAT